MDRRILIHHITEDPEQSTDVQLFLNSHTNWQYSWGLGSNIPPTTSVLVVPAHMFLSYRNTHPKQHNPFLELVYGPPTHLVACYIAKCDDYLKDEWSTVELYYRISCLVGRDSTPLINHPIVVRPSFVSVGTDSIKISAKEYEILKILLRNINQVVPKHVISELVLEKAQNTHSRAIDVHICSIRAKLSQLLPPPMAHRMIQTVYSSGYRMVTICE